VIEKKEMRFLRIEKKEMKDKEFQEEGIGLAHLIYKENNIHYRPSLKEFYQFFQEMESWIQRDTWINS
jgi:hypothetical protein